MTVNAPLHEAPAPLVPATVDLRAYDWFPFYHKRLRQSSFWKRASDLACRISVDLWAEAYEQVPAASLPDDDYLLGEWAGFGRRDISGWLAVKEEVMSAWVQCSDGRYYHPVLSEVACKAWVDRRLRLWGKECDRIRKENVRREKSSLARLDMPPKPSDNPFEEVDDASPSTGSVGTSHGRPAEQAQISERRPEEASENPAENALKGKGIEKGILVCSLRSHNARADASPKRPAGQLKATKLARRHAFPPNAFDRWYSAYPHKVGRAAAEKAFAKVQAGDAVAFETLVKAVERYKQTKPPDREWCNPSTWLNQARWADEPATSLVAPSTSTDSEPKIDLGGEITAKPSTIRDVWGRGRWPADWGPRPDQAGCRIPPETMAAIMAVAA